MGKLTEPRTQKELDAKAGDTVVEDFPRAVGNSVSMRHNPGSNSALCVVTHLSSFSQPCLA